MRVQTPYAVVISNCAKVYYPCVVWQVILEGTDEHALHPGTVWRDFEFTCKPGDINRYLHRPSLYSPFRRACGDAMFSENDPQGNAVGEYFPAWYRGMISLMCRCCALIYCCAIVAVTGGRAGSRRTTCASTG
jgi:hypothetical protein